MNDSSLNLNSPNGSPLKKPVLKKGGPTSKSDRIKIPGATVQFPFIISNESMIEQPSGAPVENSVVTEVVDNANAMNIDLVKELEEKLLKHSADFSKTHRPFIHPASGADNPRKAKPLGTSKTQLRKELSLSGLDEAEKEMLRDINNPLWAPFGSESLQEKERRVAKEGSTYNSLPPAERKAVVSGVKTFDGAKTHKIAPRPVSDAPEVRYRLSKVDSSMSVGSGSLTIDESLDSTPAYLQPSEQEAKVAELNQFLPVSLIREQLHNLDAFVFGNSNRKMLSNWLVIEGKFLASNVQKAILKKNPQTGLNYTVQHKALPISTLTATLCSTRVKIKHTELAGLYALFKDFGLNISFEELFYSRCLAAARALLSNAQASGQPHDEKIEADITRILNEMPHLEDLVVTLDEMRDVVFAKEPDARALQLEQVEKQRESMVAEHLEEKKKKVEMNERAEQRKAKATADFKSYLREIQFSKGIITIGRLDSLHQIIENCHKLIAEVESTNDVKFPPDLVDLLGIDCFPLHTRKGLSAVFKPSLKSPALKRQGSMLPSPGERKMNARIGYEGQARIPLWGPPSLLEVIKLAVSFGRGLRGFSYRDVVELLQSYCSTRLQAFVRAYLRRYRFRAARGKWRIIFGRVKALYFSAWARESQHQVAMRRHCWRKIKVWRQYRVKAEWRRMLFRQCYWPFYVWRRYSQKLATAREKAKFLCGRVIPTIWKMRCYRAWKRHARYTLELRQRGQKHYRGVLLKKASSLIGFLHEWAHQNKILRKSWFKDGLIRMKKNIYKCKNIPFQIWRAYVVYKKVATARAKLKAPSFFRNMFPNAAFKTPVSRMDRKKKMRVLWLKAEREERKKRKAEEEAYEKLRKQESVKRPAGGLQRANSGKPGSAAGGPGASAGAVQADPEAPLEEEEEEDELEHYLSMFDWNIDVSAAGVVDVDEVEGDFEDKEDFDNIELPQVASNVYENQVSTLFGVRDLHFLAFCDVGIQRDVEGLRDGIIMAEQWRMLENSFRFQKFARRALYHLRDNARIRRNATDSIYALNMKRKLMAFHALYIWMKKVNNVDPGAPGGDEDTAAALSAMSVDVNDQTDAERLSNMVRNSRLHRMLRRRAAISDMKEMGVVDESDADVDALMQPHKKGMNEALRIATALYGGAPKKKKNVITPAMLMGGAMAAPQLNANVLVAPEPPSTRSHHQRPGHGHGHDDGYTEGSPDGNTDILFIDNNHAAVGPDGMPCIQDVSILTGDTGGIAEDGTGGALDAEHDGEQSGRTALTGRSDSRPTTGVTDDRSSRPSSGGTDYAHSSRPHTGEEGGYRSSRASTGRSGYADSSRPSSVGVGSRPTTGGTGLEGERDGSGSKPGTAASHGHRATTAGSHHGSRPTTVGKPGTAASHGHRATTAGSHHGSKPGTADHSQHSSRPTTVGKPGTAASHGHRATTAGSHPGSKPGTAHSYDHKPLSPSQLSMLPGGGGGEEESFTRPSRVTTGGLVSALSKSPRASPDTSPSHAQVYSQPHSHTSGHGHGHGHGHSSHEHGHGHSSHGHGHGHGHSNHGHSHGHGHGHGHSSHGHGHSSHGHGHSSHGHGHSSHGHGHGHSSHGHGHGHGHSSHGHGHGHGHSGHKSRSSTPKTARPKSRAKRELEGIRRSINKKEILEWDKEDRLQIVAQAEDMCKLSQKLLEDSRKIVEVADDATALAMEGKKRESSMLVGILKAEEDITAGAVQNELKYVSEFKIHAADNLVTVLAKVNRDVQLQMLKAETKKYFRALRGPLSERLSLMMYNRKKLSNYIRICKRLIAIDKKIPRYRRLRTMWVIFNRWLKLVEREQMNVTPGLIPTVKRCCELLPGYSKLLASRGIKDVVYVSSVKLATASSEFGATFLRWQMCVQETKIFNILSDKATKLFRLNVLFKVFYALRFHIAHHDSAELRAKSIGFPIIRLQTDLDQVCKRFIALRRLGLQHVVGSYNRRFVAFTVADAKQTLSFKRFLKSYKSAVSLRLTTEQRVLSESFEQRGQQEFMDVRAPKSLPNSMSRLDGKRFADPYIPEDEHGMGTWVPAGYKLSSLRLNMQEGVGIVGWQVVWSADTAKEINSRKRGKWNGAAMQIHEIHVPQDDFVQGVEYLYDASTIVGLRLRFVWGGWSRWIGGKTSMSTLPLYLHSAMAPKEDFEDEFRPAGDDEEKNPAMPRNFVVGFTGLESSTTNISTCLGLVVRKIIHQHLFSYSWVQDSIDRYEDEGRILDPNEECESDDFSSASEGEDSFYTSLGLEEPGSDSDDDAAEGEGEDKFKLPPLPTKNLNSSGGLGTMSRAPSGIPGSSRMTGRQGMTSARSTAGSRAVSADSSEGGASRRRRKVRRKGVRSKADPNATHQKIITSASESHFSVVTSNSNVQGNLAREIALLEREDVAEGDNLLTSERQFFDVVRMRLTETNSAEARAEAFARRLWTNKIYRESSEFKILTSINILAHLTKWYFQAMCRRLCRVITTESEGTSLVTESQAIAIKATNAAKRSVASAAAAAELEGTRQSWMSSLMLSPEERRAKREYLDTIAQLKADAKADEKASVQMEEQSVRMERRGKELLPRLELSKYVCNYYRLKIDAARHMQSLLERMDLQTLKSSLSGNAAGSGGFSGMEMDIIRSNLRKRAPVEEVSSKLEDIVNEELVKHQEQQRMLRDTLRHNKLLERSGSMNRLLIDLDGKPGKVSRGSSFDSLDGSAVLNLSLSMASKSLGSLPGIANVTAPAGLSGGVQASRAKKLTAASNPIPGASRTTGYKPPKKFVIKKRPKKEKLAVKVDETDQEEKTLETPKSVLSRQLEKGSGYMQKTTKISNAFISAAALAMKEEAGGTDPEPDPEPEPEPLVVEEVEEVPEPAAFSPVPQRHLSKSAGNAPGRRGGGGALKPPPATKPRKIIQVNHHPKHKPSNSSVRFDDEDNDTQSINSLGSASASSVASSQTSGLKGTLRRRK